MAYDEDTINNELEKTIQNLKKSKKNFLECSEELINLMEVNNSNDFNNLNEYGLKIMKNKKAANNLKLTLKDIKSNKISITKSKTPENKSNMINKTSNNTPIRTKDTRYKSPSASPQFFQEKNTCFQKNLILNGGNLENKSKNDNRQPIKMNKHKSNISCFDKDFFQKSQFNFLEL